MKILFSFLIYFLGNIVTNACSDFINKIDATLIIPTGQACFLEDESINNFIFKKIIIDGTLSINDKVSLHIRYESISIGEQGLLEIGQEQPILNTLIVIEDVSNSICQEPINTQSIGKIKAQSRLFERITINDVIKSSKQIKSQFKPSNILSYQDYIILDILSLDQPESITVSDIQEWNIHLKDQIKKDYFSNDINREIKIKPFIFSDVPSFSGIIFKNSCITGTIDKFSGITILNPRGLYLKGNQIYNSLIKIDKSLGDYKNRIIKAESSFQKNIFLNCQDLTLQISSNKEDAFSDNIVLLSNNFTLQINIRYLKQFQIINSKLLIDSRETVRINFNNIQSYNSEIIILNKENSFVVVEQSSLFYKNSIFQVSNLVQEIQIIKSFFFSTPLTINGVSQKFYTSQTYFDGSNEIDHFAIMKNLPTKQYISLAESTFIGYKSYLITTQDKQKLPQSQYFSRGITDILYYIYVSYPYLSKREKDQQHYFNLPMMNLKLYKNYDTYFIQQIDDYNIDNQNLKLSKYKWAPVLTYQITNTPTYYQIRDINPVNSSQKDQINVKLSMNESSKYQIYNGQLIQIIKDQIQHVHIENSSGGKEDLQDFTIQLDQLVDNDSTNSEKIITFTSYQRAIKSISVVNVNGNQETNINVKTNYNDIQYYYELQFLWLQSLNQYSFVWKDIKSGSQIYKVKLQYCAENEYFDGKQCLATCSESQSGLFCSQECGEGFFKDPSNPKICKQCPFGCKQCTDNTTCSKCFDQYFKDEQRCIDVCGQKQIGYKNSCKKCKNDCQNCSSPDICENCIEPNAYFYSSECKVCNENQTEYCQDCPKNCKTCIHRDEFGCIECADGYEKVLGICKLKRQLPVVQEECSNGYSLIDGKCQQCYRGCLTCSSPNDSSRCISCFSSYINDYFGSACEKCKTGEYGDGKNCFKCNSLCDKSMSCQGPSIFQCEKCISGYFKEPKNNQCAACDLNKCKECSDVPTKCTDCFDGKFLYDSQCFDKCPSGFYPDEKRVCHPCETLLCKECAKSPTQCTECNYGQVLFEEKCYKRCQQGYFADKDSVCKQCDLNKCTECIQYETKCIKCQPGLYLINHSCEESCPDKGFYFDSQNKCQPCHEDCEKCVDIPTKCTDCEYPMYLENNKCLQQCPLGKYGAYIQSISKCVECDTSKCKACVDHKQKCTMCHDDYYLYKNECLKECPVGSNKNEVTKSCLVCLQPNCKVCGENIGFCQTCIDGHYQHEGLCVKECPSGYFLNKDQYKCQECDKRVCMECNDTPKTCIKCYPEHFSVGNGVCSTSCPKFMYPLQEGDQQICRPCDPVCTKGCVGPLESECLEAVYITQEAKNEAIMIGLIVVCFILLIGIVGLGYMYYKKKKAPYKPYLLQRASQSDIGTVIQLEDQKI